MNWMLCRLLPPAPVPLAFTWYHCYIPSFVKTFLMLASTRCVPQLPPDRLTVIPYFRTLRVPSVSPQSSRLEDHPICFDCCRVGHVACHCNSRWYRHQASYEYNRCPETNRFEPHHKSPQATSNDTSSMPYCCSASLHGRQPHLSLPRHPPSRSPQLHRPTSLNACLGTTR